MKQPTRITLIRHGETIWNRERRLQGSQDIPLSDLGLKQAESVAKRLQNEFHHRVYSSPLQRAYKTADTITQTLQLPHHVHSDLHERSYGELEGWTREQILEKYPDFWSGQRTGITGLESNDVLRKRANQTMTEIAERHPGENVLVVSHGGTISAFLYSISNGEHGAGQTRLENTSLTRVILEADGTWKIETIGDDEHLKELENDSKL